MTRCCRLRSNVRILNCTTAVSREFPKRGSHAEDRGAGTMSGCSTIFRSVRKYESRKTETAPRLATASPSQAREARATIAGFVEPFNRSKRPKNQYDGSIASKFSLDGFDNFSGVAKEGSRK